MAGVGEELVKGIGCAVLVYGFTQVAADLLVGVCAVGHGFDAPCVDVATDVLGRVHVEVVVEELRVERVLPQGFELEVQVVVETVAGHG